MSEWDGEERRKTSLDHIERDRLLTQIDTNLTYFMRQFGDHVRDDQKSFAEHEHEMGKLRDGQDDIKKYIFTAAGGVLVIAFFIKLVWR